MIYDDLNTKKSELDKQPALSADILEELRKKIELELAYVGGCFDGSSLTCKETAAILYEDKAVEKHSLTEHIQVLNAAKAFENDAERASFFGDLPDLVGAGLHERLGSSAAQRASRLLQTGHGHRYRRRREKRPVEGIPSDPGRL